MGSGDRSIGMTESLQKDTKQCAAPSALRSLVGRVPRQSVARTPSDRESVTEQPLASGNLASKILALLQLCHAWEIQVEELKKL